MIRKLEMRDLPYMYEWMHDDIVIANMQTNFANFTKEDVANFIKQAIEQYEYNDAVHYAITDDKDEYMGTISLKNINWKDKNAEYAIITRRIAHGKGYARDATNDILHLGFEEYALEKIYLYVLTKNVAANKFYQKYGFKEEGVFRKHLLIHDKFEDVRWYSVLKEEFMHKQ